MMMMGGYGGYGVYWWMGLSMLIRVLFWGGAIFLAYKFFRHYSMRHHKSMFTENDKALDILRERYARGEIDSEEFQRGKEVLQK